MIPSSPARPVAQRRRHLIVGTLAGLGVVLLAACESSPSKPPPRAERMPLQSVLTGSASALAGALQIEARVTPFGAPARPRQEDGTKIDRGGVPGGGRPGGGGMRPGRGEGMSGGMGGGPGGPPPDEGGGGPGARQRPAGGMMMARQTLHVSLRNTSAEPLEVGVTELRSLIGNFAPRPSRLVIAPGQTAVLDPVSGDAGGVLDAVDVHVAVRRAGRGESLVIRLTRAQGQDSGPRGPLPDTR